MCLKLEISTINIEICVFKENQFSNKLKQFHLKSEIFIIFRYFNFEIKNMCFKMQKFLLLIYAFQYLYTKNLITTIYNFKLVFLTFYTKLGLSTLIMSLFFSLILEISASA